MGEGCRAGALALADGQLLLDSSFSFIIAMRLRLQSEANCNAIVLAKRSKDSRTRTVDRRTLLQLVGTVALGRAIGLGAAQTARATTAPLLPNSPDKIRTYPFPVDILYHGSRARPQIALTFDACPRKERPDFSPEIVNYLQREHIPATFFVSGLWAENCQDGLKQLASVPYFQIGLHGYHHWKSSELSEQVIASEIELTRSTLVRLGANPKPFFRPPYEIGRAHV